MTTTTKAAYTRKAPRGYFRFEVFIPAAAGGTHRVGQYVTRAEAEASAAGWLNPTIVDLDAQPATTIQHELTRSHEVADLLCVARIAFKELEYIADGESNPVTLAAALRQLSAELAKWS